IYGALNSSIAQRYNLWSSSNLGLAGCGPVGISEPASASSLSVIPLAVPGAWTVHFPSSGLWELAAYNSTGQLVGNWYSESAPLVVDLAGKAAGMYLFRASTSAENTYHAKVVLP
ncbi:MAG: hypothetical protein ABIY71_12925, partial [Flavobacteriales bacterium]